MVADATAVSRNVVVKSLVDLLMIFAAAMTAVATTAARRSLAVA